MNKEEQNLFYKIQMLEEELDKYTKLYSEKVEEIIRLEKALDKACEELTKDNFTRLVIMGGRANDYKKHFLEESEKQ